MNQILKTSALKSTTKLQPHQEDVVNAYGRSNKGLLVNHGLGSGKTLSSIAIAEKHAPNGKKLVIVPAALQDNYRKELQNFADDHSKYHVVSYAKFRQNPDDILKNVNPEMVIADEVHRARNQGKTRDALAKARAHAPHFVGLTGSLSNNHPTDGVSVLGLVDPKIDVKTFSRKHMGIRKVKPGFLGRLRGAKPGEVEYIRDPAGARAYLGHAVHRFEGTPEYRAHLPKKVVSNVDVEMSPEQEDIIKAVSGGNPMLAYKIKHNIPPSRREAAMMNAFSQTMRQASNSPVKFMKDNEGKDFSVSPKMRRMRADIEAAQKNDPNFRGVVYSNYLDAGARPLVDRSGGAMYEGKLSQKKRKELLGEFAKGDHKVLGISPAGAEGIDLKGVKLMQIMEPDWNPERTNQAIGRSVRYKSHAHLPEEERKVLVNQYRSVHKRPTGLKKLLGRKAPTSIDEYIHDRAMEKQRLNDEFAGLFRRN